MVTFKKNAETFETKRRRVLKKRLDILGKVPEQKRFDI